MDILIPLIEQGSITKEELRRLTDELGLHIIYNRYKDKYPFTFDVAINLLNELLDQESNTLLALSKIRLFQWYEKDLFKAENPRSLFLKTLKQARFSNHVIRCVEEKLTQGMAQASPTEMAIEEAWMRFKEDSTNHLQRLVLR